jgi:Putative auto-transporter adhesin, head GIN domain
MKSNARNLVLVIFLSLTINSITLATKAIRGDGNLKTISQTVSSFNKLVVKSTYLNVEVFCSKMPLVEITTDANILPYLTTEVSNRTLTLDNEKDYYLIPTRCLIRVSTEFLNQLDTYRETLVVKVKGIDTQIFNLTVNEGELTKIILEGKAEIFNIKSEGAEIDASKFIVKNVKVKAETNKNVTVFASESLDANIEGNGKCTYLGNPKTLKTNIEEHEKKRVIAQKQLDLTLEKTPYIMVKLINNQAEDREFYVTGLNPYIGKTYGYGFKIKALGIKMENLPEGSKIYRNNRLGKKLLIITKEMKNQTIEL